jgi:Fanconi anemia group M protein
MICVGEEGLDVSDTDLVVLYEPVPWGIRSIQRWGCTDRNDLGRVMVLVTYGTRDETSLLASMSKEASMRPS